MNFRSTFSAKEFSCEFQITSFARLLIPQYDFAGNISAVIRKCRTRWQITDLPVRDACFVGEHVLGAVVTRTSLKLASRNECAMLTLSFVIRETILISSVSNNEPNQCSKKRVAGMTPCAYIDVRISPPVFLSPPRNNAWNCMHSRCECVYAIATIVTVWSQKCNATTAVDDTSSSHHSGAAAAFVVWAYVRLYPSYAFVLKHAKVGDKIDTVYTGIAETIAR